MCREMMKRWQLWWKTLRVRCHIIRRITRGSVNILVIEYYYLKYIFFFNIFPSNPNALQNLGGIARFEKRRKIDWLLATNLIFRHIYVLVFFVSHFMPLYFLYSKASTLRQEVWISVLINCVVFKMCFNLQILYRYVSHLYHGHQHYFFAVFLLSVVSRSFPAN